VPETSTRKSSGTGAAQRLVYDRYCRDPSSQAANIEKRAITAVEGISKWNLTATQKFVS